MKMNNTLFKKVDGEKIKKWFNEHPEFVKSKVCEQARVNRGVITDAQSRNSTRIIFWDAICDVIGVPRDYFDLVEPVAEQKKIETPDDSDRECLVDLADIQLSLNKIEGLMLRQLELLNMILCKDREDD